MRTQIYREQGSAYLITLLSLVVLTMLALALTYATQTELLVGSNERIIQRAFYAAESGIHIAAASVLGKNDKCGKKFEFNDVPTGEPGSNIKARVEYTDILPLYHSPCNYCSVNDSSESGSQIMIQLQQRIESRSTLFGAADTTVATKIIRSTIDSFPVDYAAATPPQCDTAEPISF